MISIIIPAHNEATYIGACVESLLNQHCSFPYEVIVVNNCSTDNTLAIAKKYDVVVLNEEIPNVLHARNIGALKSKYDNLLFLDADCVVTPDYLSKVNDYFDTRPDLIAFGGPYIYHDGGKLVEYVTYKLNYFGLYSDFINFLFGVKVIAGGCFAIRKPDFLSIGMFNESFKNQNTPEDLDLCIRLTKKNLKLEMIKDLALQSSFRRQKRITAPRDTFYRSFGSLKLLMSARG